MNKRPATRRHSYDATERKTFRSSLCHLLQTEFPGVFGPAVTRLFSERIDELYQRFHPPASRFAAGQCLVHGGAIGRPRSAQQGGQGHRLGRSLARHHEHEP